MIPEILTRERMRTPQSVFGSSSLGSTGDPPVPSGDPPDGTGATMRANEAGLFTGQASAIPVGGSPTGAGESAALPIFKTRSHGLGSAHPKRCARSVGDVMGFLDRAGGCSLADPCQASHREVLRRRMGTKKCSVRNKFLLLAKGVWLQAVAWRLRLFSSSIRANPAWADAAFAFE